MFVFKCTAIVCTCHCLTNCFRVTVSAVLSLVALLINGFSLLPPACKCDMYEQINFDLI